MFAKKIFFMLLINIGKKKTAAKKPLSDFSLEDHRPRFSRSCND